jgi:hypothetical protein
MQTDLTPAGSERRQWPRIPASQLTGVSASFVNGPDVRLVNLSCGGTLVEVPARYPMRSFVRVKLTGPTGEGTIAPGNVAWAKVASIVNGQVTYLIAVIFAKPILDLAAATGVQALQPDAAASAASDLPSITGPPSDLPSITASDVMLDIPPPATLELAGLDPFDDERNALRGELEAARRQWEEEKSRLVTELAEAAMRADSLAAALETHKAAVETHKAALETHEAALETCKQEHLQALGEQHGRYETRMAELLEAANDQQAEYSRERAVLEAHGAAHEARYRALRQEAERLISILTAPVEPASARQDNVGAFQPGAWPAHALA